jgi:hypothetical protein
MTKKEETTKMEVPSDQETIIHCLQAILGLKEAGTEACGKWIASQGYESMEDFLTHSDPLDTMATGKLGYIEKKGEQMTILSTLHTTKLRLLCLYGQYLERTLGNTLDKA